MEGVKCGLPHKNVSIWLIVIGSSSQKHGQHKADNAGYGTD